MVFFRDNGKVSQRKTSTSSTNRGVMLIYFTIVLLHLLAIFVCLAYLKVNYYHANTVGL